MTRIKNCGLSRVESIDCAITSGAAFAGFVHHEKSPRHVSLAQMAALCAHAASLIKTVAVLVNPADELLANIAANVKPHFFQLHQVADSARIQSIEARFGIPIITAISVKSPSDLTHIAAFEEISAHLLFDAPEAGSGQPIDWSLLKNLPLRKKWFLAGGLTAENVTEALRLTHAPMVDVSSGIEEPKGSGNKSLEKIARFNQAVLGSA